MNIQLLACSALLLFLSLMLPAFLQPREDSTASISELDTENRALAHNLLLVSEAERKFREFRSRIHVSYATGADQRGDLTDAEREAQINAIRNEIRRETLEAWDSARNAYAQSFTHAELLELIEFAETSVGVTVFNPFVPPRRWSSVLILHDGRLSCEAMTELRLFTQSAVGLALVERVDALSHDILQGRTRLTGEERDNFLRAIAGIEPEDTDR
jgi:hypothetical protein